MFCIPLSILVIIAGVFLLAKTKTDNLGTGYKFAAYSSILAGIIMIGMSLMMCISHCCANKGHHGQEYHQSCYGHDGCSGATCCKGGSKCFKGGKSCKYDAKCFKSQKCKKGSQKNCSKTVTINTTVDAAEEVEAIEEEAVDAADN